MGLFDNMKNKLKDSVQKVAESHVARKISQLSIVVITSNVKYTG